MAVLVFCVFVGFTPALAQDVNAPAAQQQTAALGTADEQDVAVTVNGVDITEAQVQAKIEGKVKALSTQLAPNLLDQYRSRVRKETVESMIVQHLMDEKVRQAGIVVTDKDVEDKLKEIALQQNRTIEDLKKLVEAQGGDFNDMKQEMKANLKYAEFMEKESAGKTDANETDARKYYDENIERFNAPERVQASHILITVEPTASEEDKSKAKQKTEQLLQQLKDGADFAVLAREHSGCPSSAKGGDLGYFDRGRMVKPFEDVAFALEPGQVSGVVETQFGYHIIKVTDHKQAGLIPFEEVKDQIINYLKQTRQQEFYKQYIEKLKAEANIVYPAKKIEQQVEVQAEGAPQPITQPADE